MKSKKQDNPNGKKTIMIVDDEEAIRMLITSFLEKDYNIIDLNDGHEALVYLSKNNLPDMILLDMEMPHVNGRVFVRKFKNGGIKNNNVPIIFISSVQSKSIIQSMLNLGVADYIVKPFNPEELVAKINAILT